MAFDFLFRNFEGVFSLKRRKTKLLAFLSLLGLLVAVGFAVTLSLKMELSRHLPGVIVFACMMIGMLVFLLNDRYQSAVNVWFVLPLAIYFFYINPSFSLRADEYNLHGILRMLYFGFLFLFIFSYSKKVFLVFYTVSVAVVVYSLYSFGELETIFNFTHITILGIGNPLLELTLVAGLQSVFYYFYNDVIERIENENVYYRSLFLDTLRKKEDAVMVLRFQRDQFNEKSGMIVQRTNRAFDHIFKVSKEEVWGADFSDVFPKIFRDSFNWQDVFYHSVIPRKDVFIPHLSKWFVVNNVNTSDDIVVSTFHDVSTFNQELNRLKLREARLTELMGSLPDIFLIIEKNGTYLEYVTNNKELELKGKEDIVGKTIFEMGFSSVMTTQLIKSIAQVLEYDTIETIEYGLQGIDGRQLVFEMRLAKLNANQVISIGRDVTAKKEYYKQLVAAKKVTDEAIRVKELFIENISHELRTPMNAILGFAGLALEEDLTDNERNEYLGIVVSSGEDLLAVFNNLIDISNIEAGSFIVNEEAFSINNLFDKIEYRVQKLGAYKKGKISTNLSKAVDDYSFMVNSDSSVIEKILIHLIDNALKFTTEGEVVYGYEIQQEDVRFFVKDTGIGISEEEQLKIYNHFYQVDKSDTRSYGGTGIGLSIVKSLILLIGSEIHFESKTNLGTTFYFDVPLYSCCSVSVD